MSDLISREAVINYLREQHDSLTIEQNKLSIVHPEAIRGMRCSNEAFNLFILGLPTAYDVDKVVEELKHEAKALYSLNNFEPVSAWLTEDAINLVKGGGQG